MIRYLITTHGHLEGVRLSKLGHWGNIPYPTDLDAVQAAHRDAKGAPYRLERKAFPALPSFTTRHPLT